MKVARIFFIAIFLILICIVDSVVIESIAYADYNVPMKQDQR